MPMIALEFRHQPGNLAANGTDVLMYLDGRWGTARRREAIYAKVAALREGPRRNAYRNQHFVGFTVMGTGDYSRPEPHVKMSDREPPAWVARPTLIQPTDLKERV